MSQEKALEAVDKAAQRVSKADEQLRRERLALRSALKTATEEGVSLSALGRVLGVTRQRVKQMLEQQ